MYQTLIVGGGDEGIDGRETRSEGRRWLPGQMATKSLKTHCAGGYSGYPVRTDGRYSVQSQTGEPACDSGVCTQRGSRVPTSHGRAGGVAALQANGINSQLHVRLSMPNGRNVLCIIHLSAGRSFVNSRHIGEVLALTSRENPVHRNLRELRRRRRYKV